MLRRAPDGAFAGKARGVGFFFRSKAPEVVGATGELNEGVPALPFAPNAIDARLIRAHQRSVAHIDDRWNRPKVSNSIVGLVLIYVIERLQWPLAVNIEPRKAMCFVMVPRDLEIDITPHVEMPGPGAHFYPVVRPDAPREFARLWRIVQEFFQALLRNQHAAYYCEATENAR